MAIFQSGKPLPADILSVSQGDLLANNNWVPLALGKDHQIATPNSNSATTFEGRHIQVTFNDRTGTEPDPAIAPLPDGMDSLLYSAAKKLFWRSTNGGQTAGVQMTVDSPWASPNAYSLFGKIVNNYNGVGAAFSGGWTFLPGGLLLNYGFVNGYSSDTDIIFPVPFTTTIAAIPIRIEGGDQRAFTQLSAAPTATKFKVIIRKESGSQINGQNIEWIAIGIA